MKSVAVAAFVLLLAAGAPAQERRRHPHHEPSPPSGITTLPAPPPPSPFAARPNTYAPHYERPSRGFGYGFGAPVYGDPFGVLPYEPPLVSAAPPPPDQSTARAPAPEPPKNPVPVPELPPIATAHGPDTFYVIPGCYAGNHPPNPARLPRGCDATKLRTLPIR